MFPSHIPEVAWLVEEISSATNDVVSRKIFTSYQEALAEYYSLTASSSNNVSLIKQPRQLLTE